MILIGKTFTANAVLNMSSVLSQKYKLVAASTIDDTAEIEVYSTFEGYVWRRVELVKYSELMNLFDLNSVKYCE